MRVKTLERQEGKVLINVDIVIIVYLVISSFFTISTMMSDENESGIFYPFGQG